MPILPFQDITTIQRTSLHLLLFSSLDLLQLAPYCLHEPGVSEELFFLLPIRLALMPVVVVTIVESDLLENACVSH